MVHEDIQIVRMDQGIFRRMTEEIGRIADNVLVQTGRGGHENGQRGIFPPACTSRFLPGTGNGSWISAHDAHIQLSDINAQFQGIGGDNGPDTAAAKAAFNFAPQRGQVSAAVTADFSGIAQGLPDPFLEMPGNHLDTDPGFGKDDGGNVVVHHA